jgi:hypothetical protein
LAALVATLLLPTLELGSGRSEFRGTLVENEPTI